MNGINRVTIAGNLGTDPELRYTPGGHPVCNASLATNESWTDKEGVKQERTEWHRLVLWGKQAEVFHEFLKKGGAVLVEGKLQTRSWDDEKSGTKRYSTEVVVREFHFLDGAKKGDRPPEPPPVSDDDHQPF